MPRPPLSPRGDSRTLSIRLSPDDFDRIERLKAALGASSIAAVVRRSMEIAEDREKRRRARKR